VTSALWRPDSEGAMCTRFCQEPPYGTCANAPSLLQRAARVVLVADDKSL
jgi:hypothetical protein